MKRPDRPQQARASLRSFPASIQPSPNRLAVPSSTPLPRHLRELLNIHRTRNEKGEEPNVMQSERLTHTQQDKVLLYARLRARAADHFSEKHEPLDRMFGIVVIPRDPIIIEKRE